MTEAIVKTKNGWLRGQRLRSIENYEYYAFKGIPYAKPPVKELRFKDPEPPDNWSGIRDATKCGNPCLQYDSTVRSFIGSEDCLYLNVYTSTIESKENLKPVMMFIHGSGFFFGSGNDESYGPDYLIKKDIVLVTINHRLGIFGFLNLEDEICSGNQGLKDTVMALKWIHHNIQNFGGDPKNVTVFGESAGAFCTHMLALSPMSKGLVHKIICQSGTAANIWATVQEPKKFVFQLCTVLGKVILKPKLIFEFLRNMDCDRLIKAQEKLRKQIADANKHQNIDLIFGPAVDSKSPNPFMPIPIEEAVQQGVDIPFLIGYNSFEGSYFLLGAGHFDELTYLFYNTLYDKLGISPLKDSKKGYKVMNQMTEMWTNFAKYGNPTPKTSELLPVIWKPVDNVVNIPYLDINEELSMMTMAHIAEKFKKYKYLKG